MIVEIFELIVDFLNEIKMKHKSTLNHFKYLFFISKLYDLSFQKIISTS
jgi:hypothetical protein